MTNGNWANTPEVIARLRNEKSIYQHNPNKKIRTFADVREYFKSRKIIAKDGGLYDLSWYLCWHPGVEEGARLDGEFTADDLEAICIYMRGQETIVAGLSGVSHARGSPGSKG